MLLSKAKNIRVSQNLLEQRQLSVCVLPMPVEEVHREKTLKALGLKAKLESLHEENETGAVIDAETGMIQLVDNLLPVQRRLQLVHRFDEHLGIEQW